MEAATVKERLTTLATGMPSHNVVNLMPRKSSTTPSRWSQRVTSTSNALDLEMGVFSSTNPRSIAASLKRSADRSRRRKASPFQSAMSMLNFYINRAGKALPVARKRVLTDAKRELRRLYGR